MAERNKTLVNYNIRTEWCRVVSESGPRVVKTLDAIDEAQAQGLDLVQISWDNKDHLPVCKMQDYGKYVYEQKRREKDAKRQARANRADVKTIQFSLTIDDNDKSRLLKQAREFLLDGDKVKMTIRFRSKRESANTNMAKDLLRSMLETFNDIAVLDSNVTMTGREMSCILAKKKGV